MAGRGAGTLALYVAGALAYDRNIDTERQMPTATFAVQPRAWTTFDEWGCEWATDMNHAYRLARAFGEECTIWRVPHIGNAYAWANAGAVH